MTLANVSIGGAHVGAHNEERAAINDLSTVTASAAAPSGGDDLATLQAAVNAFGGNGGTLSLRSGTYLLSNTLIVPNKVSIRGRGRSSTLLQAHSTFPTTGVPLIQLGPTGLAFASRIQDCSVNCNNVAGSIGVYSYQGQEMCGLERVTVSDFKATGIHFDTGAANFTMEDIEVYPSSSGATTGILLHCAGSQIIKKATIGVSGALTVGISVLTGELTAIGVHIENCTDGILFDQGRGVVIGVSGPTTLANVTNLVRGTGNTRYFVIINASKNSATNTYKADFFGVTNTDSFVQQAVMGNGMVARLQHNGDQAGFYGKAPITRPAALTAAVAVAPAGGTGTAAGGWSTAADRDTAIALINNLRTRVIELESRLNTSAGLGLISG